MSYDCRVHRRFFSVNAMKTKRLRSFCLDSEGSALVEAALVLPVLVTLVFGVLEFSWFFYQQHLVSMGLRDAARYLARSSAPCLTVSSDWLIEEQYARNIATTGVTDGNSPARVKGWQADMVTFACQPIQNTVESYGLSTYRGAATIYVITASTRFTDSSLGFFELLGLKAPTISVSHAERVIGPG